MVRIGKLVPLAFFVHVSGSVLFFLHADIGGFPRPAADCCGEALKMLIISFSRALKLDHLLESQAKS